MAKKIAHTIGVAMVAAMLKASSSVMTTVHMLNGDHLRSEEDGALSPKDMDHVRERVEAKLAEMTSSADVREGGFTVETEIKGKSEMTGEAKMTHKVQGKPLSDWTITIEIGTLYCVEKPGRIKVFVCSWSSDTIDMGQVSQKVAKEVTKMIENARSRNIIDFVVGGLSVQAFMGDYYSPVCDWTIEARLDRENFVEIGNLRCIETQGRGRILCSSFKTALFHLLENKRSTFHAEQRAQAWKSFTNFFSCDSPANFLSKCTTDLEVEDDETRKTQRRTNSLQLGMTLS